MQTPTAFDKRNAPHEEFKPKVIDFLESRNYVVQKQGFHELFSPEIIHVMKKNNVDITTLYKRTIADYFAIKRDGSDSLDVEIKTNDNSHRIDGQKSIVVEAAALIFHIYQSKCGVRCLYCWQDISNGKELGFWADNFELFKPYYDEKGKRLEPTLEAIHFSPSENTSEHYDTTVRWMVYNMLEHRVRVNNRHNKPYGSGNPYARILERNFDRLKHWKDLVP